MEKKLFGHRKKGHAPKEREETAKDNPSKYEGSEHIKYKNPGYSEHDIRYPKDEPKMKSRVSKSEMHEMEDNFHKEVPNQTKDTLPAKIPRARMKMDAPDHDEPDELQGNMVRETEKKGVKDTSGEEQTGPNDMQKESRKKMIVAVMKRKMRKASSEKEE